MRKFILVAVLALVLAPVARAEFHAPQTGFWHYCGAGVWGWHGAKHYTSCPFARNIALGVRKSPQYGSYRLIGDAYSPVTHKTYIVNCILQSRYRAYTYKCTAGIGAIVWVG